MTKSRREFIGKGFQSLLTLPLIAPVRLNLGRDKEQRFELLFDQLRLINMRERYRFDNRWSAMSKRNQNLDLSIDIESSKNLDTKDIPEFTEKLLESSFHALLTKINDHAEHSISILRGLSGIEKWDRVVNSEEEDIGLDYASKMVVSQAFTSDWLGQLLSNGARADCIAGIGSRGLETIERGLLEIRDSSSYNGWWFRGQSKTEDPIPREYIWESFLPLMSASALIIGAISFSKQFGNNSRVTDWINLGLEVLKDRSTLYHGDGSFPGAASQAALAGLYMGLATDVLNNFDVIDIRDNVNWPGVSRYLSDMSYSVRSSQPRLVDFGDVETSPNSGLPYWIAKASNDSFSNHFGTEIWGVHDQWGLINFNHRVRGGIHEQRTSLTKYENQTIVSRASKEDGNLFVAMRSGGPFHGEHGDVNALVIGAFGDLFVVNPDRERASNADEKLAMRRPKNRNVVLIDDTEPHFSDSFLGVGRSLFGSKITRHFASPDYAFWSSNATDAYRHDNSDLNMLTRSVFVSNYGHLVLVIDKLSMNTSTVNIKTGLVINNEDDSTEIKQRDNNLIVTRPSGSMMISSFGFNGALVEKTGENLGDGSFIKLASRTSRKNQQQFLVTCLSFAESGKDIPKLELKIGRNNSIIVERNDLATRYQLTISDSGNVPEINQEIRDHIGQ